MTFDTKIKVYIMQIASDGGRIQPIPEYATAGSACIDLSANTDADIILEPSQKIIIPTGIALEMPPGIVGLIFPRSGLGIKHGIVLSNSVGVIDSDYRGQIHVGLVNNGIEPYTIHSGDRIAQMAFMPVYLGEFIKTASLTPTDRGQGGFGSTGIGDSITIK